MIERFKYILDPRGNRTKYHGLVDIRALAVCCRLCAGERFNDMEDSGKAMHDWFTAFLKLIHGIPSHGIFNREFAAHVIVGNPSFCSLRQLEYFAI